MEHNNETFHYTYSAKEQEEVKHIRQKYVPKEADKMEQLRRLDAATTRKGSVAALIVGTLGALIFGTGMSCVMLLEQSLWFALGIVIGVVGLIGIALAYPIYSHITQKEREKAAPEILRLTEELLK